MRFSTVIAVITASAGFAAACEHAIELQVKACIKTEQPAVDACDAQDFHCLCPAYTKLYTCYNPCQDDPLAGSVLQEKQLNCQYDTTTSKTSKTPQTTNGGGPIIQTTMPSPTLTSVSISSPGAVTETGGAETTSKIKGALTSTPNGAMPYAVPAGGALAAVLGLAGLL